MTHNKPAPREGVDKQERVTNEAEDHCRDKKETNDMCEESVKQFSVASQAVNLMDEEKEEQRPWEETPDTQFSVGATTALSKTASRETVGGRTQGKEEATPTSGSSPSTTGSPSGSGSVSTSVGSTSCTNSGKDTTVSVGATAGTEDNREGPEAESMPLTEMKETMVREEDEVEEVDQDHEIQIVDISMEE